MKKITNINKETKNEIEARSSLYNTVVSNLQAFGVDSGAHVAIGNFPPELLYVDPRIQGLRQHKNTMKIVNNFDIRKLAPIVVVLHPEEKRASVVDGKCRVEVATILGKEKLPVLTAIVLMDAPQDDLKARLRFEAEYFRTQDDGVQKLKPLEKHLASVICKDKAACDLEEVLNKYDVAIKVTGGPRDPGVLGSYTDILATANQFGVPGLEFTFSIIKNAGWQYETNGYATHITRMFRQIFKSYKNYATEIAEYLGVALRETTPMLFAAEARTTYPIRDYRIACVLLLQDMICEHLNLKTRLQWIDGKLVDTAA